MKRTWLALPFLFAPPALACQTRLDPRAPPVEGMAKVPTADYKLEVSLMRELRKEARGGAAPPGYHAETMAPEWLESSGDDVRLTGEVQTIAIYRRATGCYARVERGGAAHEIWIPPGEFSTIFPWQGPGVSLLRCLVDALAKNPELIGWDRLSRAP